MRTSETARSCQAQSKRIGMTSGFFPLAPLATLLFLSSGKGRAISGRRKAKGKLSLADSWIAATALTHAVTLVHTDPELDRLPVLQKRL